MMISGKCGECGMCGECGASAPAREKLRRQQVSCREALKWSGFSRAETMPQNPGL